MFKRDRLDTGIPELSLPRTSLAVMAGSDTSKCKGGREGGGREEGGGGGKGGSDGAESSEVMYWVSFPLY
jgi:hypothetical protein